LGQPIWNAISQAQAYHKNHGGYEAARKPGQERLLESWQAKTPVLINLWQTRKYRALSTDRDFRL
jgi:hypothetical protein